MNRKDDSLFWSNIQAKLRQKYPQLTNADLYWRDGSNDDMFQIIALKLGIPTKDLKMIIENY